MRERETYGNRHVIQLGLLILLPCEDRLVALFGAGDVEELLDDVGAVVRGHLGDVVGNLDPSLDSL